MPPATTLSPARRPRRRTAPPARRGHGGSGIRWDRVARASLLVVLALILASYVGPAAKYVRAWKLSHETHNELVQLQEQNKRLKKRHRQLRNPRQIELEARKIGMARPDEKVYVIRGLSRSRDDR